MRRFKIVLSLIIVVMLIPVFAWSQDLAVTTKQLQQSLKDKEPMVVVDIRKADAFKAGHIPGAVNVAYGSWVANNGDLQNELPAKDELFEVIGKAGIKPDSRVVVVGSANSADELANAARVAWTLKYSGVPAVSILSGGFEKWAKDAKKSKKLVTKAVKAPEAVKYEGKVNAAMVLDKATVQKFVQAQPKPFGINIIDVREPAFWLGEKKADSVAKAGRIPGAKNLPTSKLYNADGTFKDKQDLAMIAVDVLTDNTLRGNVLYCDDGKEAAAWALMLADLGYVNSYTRRGPAIFNGSFEEWAKDPNAPVETGVPAPPAKPAAK
jgi:thiosulfate/3-mercaptopyruvate sulfurtransferase